MDRTFFINYRYKSNQDGARREFVAMKLNYRDTFVEYKHHGSWSTRSAAFLR